MIFVFFERNHDLCCSSALLLNPSLLALHAPMAVETMDSRLARLHEQADKAVTEKAGVVRRKLKDENLNITCRSQMRCEFVGCLFVLNVQVAYFFFLVATV